jgi:hypothetical protein
MDMEGTNCGPVSGATPTFAWREWRKAENPTRQPMGTSQMQIRRITV